MIRLLWAALIVPVTLSINTNPAASEPLNPEQLQQNIPSGGLRFSSSSSNQNTPSDSAEVSTCSRTQLRANAYSQGFSRGLTGGEYRNRNYRDSLAYSCYESGYYRGYYQRYNNELHNTLYRDRQKD